MITRFQHILRSIAISNIVYGSEMTLIDEKYIKEIKEVIWDFVWEGKTIRFSKEICYLPREMDGINMPNFENIV